MKAKTFLLLLVVLFLFAGACASNGGAPEPQPQEQPQEQAANASTESSPNGAQDIGEGATFFLFEVTDDNGNVSAWNIHTDEETVGAALVKLGMIEGVVTDFGLMVFYVNGLRADFEDDGAWWAFYVDGEMAMVGVDATDIEKDKTYAFVYTEA